MKHMHKIENNPRITSLLTHGDNMKRSFTLLILCVLVLRIAGHCQVPQKISYQGLLTTSGGAPVTDGSYDLKFEIFNLPSGGSVLHNETHSGVSIQRGTFSVVLGSASALPTIFGESLYVQVTALSGPGIGS